MFKAIRASLPALALAVLTACGGGDGGGTTNPTPIPGGFTVSLSSTTLSVEQGASGSVTATIGRTGSFSGTVNLSTENVPTGITASFNPAAVTSGTTSTTLSVAVAATVAPGSYTFTIRGQASGLTDQTATVTMTVTPKPAIAMALSATAATVVQGSSTSYTATITRTNFTGAVTVAVTGAPTGVTATVSNVADVYTVNVAVGAAVAAGNYTLTTTASGTGVANVTATYTLTVDLLRTITLSAAPAALTVSQGLSGASTITIQRLNNTASVSLAISGQPAGVGANITQPGAGNSGTITFNVGGAVTPGTYPITVTGSATGVANATTTVTLTVTANQTASIALSLSRPSLSIAQGANDATSVQIARTNFTSQVNLAVSGVPAGVTATLSNTSTLGNGVTLTVSVAAGAAVGNSTITVTASGNGVSNATVNLSLTVTAAQVGGNTSIQFCGTSASIPVWVAAKDGANNWVQLSAGANNTYSTNIATTGGLAWVTQDAATSYTLHVIYGTAAELSANQGTCVSATTRTVTGTVAGLGATNQVFLNFGGAGPTTSPTFLNPNFTITGAATGSRDLLAARASIDLANPTAFLFDKAFIKRDLNPANNGSVGTVDFNGADGFDLDSKTLTVQGVGAGEQVTAFANFTSANQSNVLLGFSLYGASNVVPFKAIPSSRTVAGDLHLITGMAGSGFSSSVPTVTRFVGTWSRDATNTTVTLGAAPSTATITTVGSAGSAVRLRAQFARQSDYSDAYGVSFTQSGASLSRAAVVTATAAFIGSASTVDLSIPDFASVAGWQNTWGLQTGTQVNWATTVTGYISGSGGAVEGATFRAGSRIGTHTP